MALKNQQDLDFTCSKNVSFFVASFTLEYGRPVWSKLKQAKFLYVLGVGEFLIPLRMSVTG